MCCDSGSFWIPSFKKKKLGHGASHNEGVICLMQPNTIKSFQPIEMVGKT
jgi:hypothetical protein